HSALNIHYVKGFPRTEALPPVLELIMGQHGYVPVEVMFEPGKEFHYSGGGFLVLEHLLSALAGKNILDEVQKFLSGLGIKEDVFDYSQPSASGYLDSGEEVPNGRLHFPAFAAGGFGTAESMALLLQKLTAAYHSPAGAGPLSHDTAVRMLHGSDRGCRAFMGCDMGLGVFTAEAGPNKIMIHQGANEGFRALYLHCYSGPDLGKGLVIYCNGDNRAVAFIAEAAQEILRAFRIQGIDFSKIQQNFHYQNLRQEQIVNLGYKTLIFDAFLPALPEEISAKGPIDPLSPFNALVGAKILSCSNQKFARAENLVSPNLPVFDPELFGAQGKVMDSWESARHNPEGKDTLVLQLKEPSGARYVSLSTKFHDGNQAEFVALYGFHKEKWVEILPKTRTQGHALLRLDLGKKLQGKIFDQVKVEMFPDGGLSRLGLFAELPEREAIHFSPDLSTLPGRFPDAIPKTKKPLILPYHSSESETKKNFASGAEVDFASRAFGAELVSASNEHYGPAAQVISPFPPIHMFDGMESSRSREPGHSEEVVIQLGKPTSISRIQLDYTFFVNNNPLYVSVHGLSRDGWMDLAPKTKTKAFAGTIQEFSVQQKGLFSQVKVITYPDGGINRIRVFGS
ncbi:MAG: serine hydrolase, partial [Bdellovibrionota bacterium]